MPGNHKRNRTLLALANQTGAKTGNWCATTPGRDYVLVQCSYSSGSGSLILEGTTDLNDATLDPVVVQTFTGDDGGLMARFPFMRVRTPDAAALTAKVVTAEDVDELS